MNDPADQWDQTSPADPHPATDFPPPVPEGADDSVTEDAPPDVPAEASAAPTEPPGITFLRSTTTQTTDRQADGDTTTEVKHRARFAVEPGAVTDQNRKYGTWKFRPAWLEVEWRDGLLVEVYASGPRVLMKDRLSDKESANTNWSLRYGTDPDTGKPYPFERDRLPEPIRATIEAYELAVAVGNGPERTRTAMPR